MNILIADDHALFVDGMRHILKNLTDSVTISTSANGEETINLLESSPGYDLVLIDLNMPSIDGLSILQRMQKNKILVPIVVISAEEDIYSITATLKAGALGFIPKSHNGQQMLNALRTVLAGDIYVPNEIRQQINTINNQQRLNPAPVITQRQLEVLKLLSQGYSNKKIAATLFLTEHTVKVHLRALFNRLNATNRTECVKIAGEKGLLKK